MGVSSDYKDQVTKSVVESLLHALESGKVKEYQASSIARVFLERIEKVSTNEELIILLDDMASEWDFFSHLATIEKGKISEFSEKKDVDKIIELTRGGKVEEAIEAIKNTNNE